MVARLVRLVARPRYVAQRLSLHARLYPAALRARRRLRREQDALTTLEDALDYANAFRWGGLRINPAQIRPEILDLLRLLAADPPRTVLEIGTLHGGTLFLWTHIARPDALLISLDYLPRFFGRFSPQDLVFRAFGRGRQRVEPLAGADSHDPRTLERVQALLGGRSLDFLFIDGDHTYQGVKRDFEMYAPLVRPGGVVAFHDVSPVTDPRTVGVEEFWREFRQSHPVEELIHPGEHLGSGIGLYRMPPT